MIIYLEIFLSVIISLELCKYIDKRTNSVLIIKEPLSRLVVFSFTFIPTFFLSCYILNYVSEYIIVPFIIFILIFITYFTIVKYLKKDTNVFQSKIEIRHKFKAYGIPLVLLAFSVILAILIIICLLNKNYSLSYILGTIILIDDLLTIFTFVKINNKL